MKRNILISTIITMSLVTSILMSGCVTKNASTLQNETTSVTQPMIVDEHGELN